MPFARDGARVFRAGRTQSKLEALAREISVAGGAAEATRVDALDPDAIEQHLDAIVKKAGSIDVSFNAVSIRGDLQGTPLVKMPCDDFALPILTGVKTHFLTGTAAARHMVKKRSGVILTLSSSAAGLSGRDHRYHLTGGWRMTPDAFRRLALAMPETLEVGHMGHPDFRVGGKIFATLGYPDERWAMVKLTPEQQEALAAGEPAVFAPVKGGWGLRGATNVLLRKAKAASVRTALMAAWRNVAPAKLAQQVNVS